MKAVTAWRMASIAIALIAGAYFLAFARAHAGDLAGLKWDAGDWIILGLSTALWVAVIGVGVLIWHALLRDLGHPIPLGQSLVVYNIAQFGKYLPGNLGHHVGRVLLASRAGIPTAVTLQTMLMEMAWAVGVAAGIALLGFFFLFQGEAGSEEGRLTLAALLCGSLLFPSALVWILNRLAPMTAKRILGDKGLRLPGLAVIALASILFLLAFLAVGLLLELHARYLFGAPGGHLLQLTTVYAWAWIAGYVTPGAPAGLGIREAVLVSSLSPMYGPAVAVGLSLSLRVATTLGDGLAFVIGLIGQRVLRKR